MMDALLHKSALPRELILLDEKSGGSF